MATPQRGVLARTLSDLIALHAFPGTAIPVGAVTVCLGGLYLVWLLARETSHR
jgi:iron complex transport system permease protein